MRTTRVILASSSPRRKELLRRLLPEFEVIVPDVDEERTDASHPVEHAANLAARKARAVARVAGLDAESADGGPSNGAAQPPALLIAADTVVFLGRRLLEKPADRDEARAFLRELSGRPHTVCTALSILRWGRGGGKSPGAGLDSDFGFAGAGRIETATLTAVCFHRLTDTEIDWYLATGEWQGVAGGYRLQDAGAALISSIRGSYTNVVGLPLETLFSILRT